MNGGLFPRLPMPWYPEVNRRVSLGLGFRPHSKTIIHV